MSSNWYEVWADEGKAVPYVLLLLPNRDDQTGVVVVDPRENCRVVHHASDYDTAKLWLLEDEYTRVEGRMTR